MSVMLQKQQERIALGFLEIYRSCISFEYVLLEMCPRDFDTGSGHHFHVENPRGRPVDTHFRTIMEWSPLSKSQHAYRKGGSHLSGVLADSDV